MAKFKVVFQIVSADAPEDWMTYEVEAKNMKDARKQAEELCFDSDVMIDAIKNIDYVDMRVKSIKKLKKVI